MKELYSFEFTKTKYDQVKPFEIDKANDIILGDLFFSHSSFLADITAAYTKYQYMELSFKPKIAICLGKYCIGKFNETDKETNLESLITFFKLLEVPDCGVHITFYEMPSAKSQSDVEINQRNFQHLWSFKESWTGDGDYILLSKYRNKPWLPKEDDSFVYEVAKEMNLKVKEFGYGQTVQEQHELVKNCKAFVSQRGNAVYFAALMKAPLVLLGGGLIQDIVIPVKDTLSAVICQNTIIGMDPDISLLENGKLVNKPFDRAVMTYGSCDNKPLLRNVVNDGHNIQQHFRENIKANKDAYYNFYDNLKDMVEGTIDGKNTVE